MSRSPERELGRLEAKMANLESDMQLLQHDVRQIRDALVGYQGGWKLLTIIIAASASLGAIAAKLPITSLFR